jgi:hypothetical protein
MCAAWRYDVCPMLEPPDLPDVYVDGIGAFEVLGETVRIITYRFHGVETGGEMKKVAVVGVVKPLLVFGNCIEQMQAMLTAMPVPQPSFTVKRLGH